VHSFHPTATHPHGQGISGDYLRHYLPSAPPPPQHLIPFLSYEEVEGMVAEAEACKALDRPSPDTMLLGNAAGAEPLEDSTVASTGGVGIRAGVDAEAAAAAPASAPATPCKLPLKAPAPAPSAAAVAAAEEARLVTPPDDGEVRDSSRPALAAPEMRIRQHTSAYAHASSGLRFRCSWNCMSKPSCAAERQ
jgi:hypothetical protein